MMRCTLALTLALFCTSALANELAGTWTLTIDTPRGPQNPTLAIEQTADGYAGVYHSLRGPLDIEKIDWDGNEFSFTTTITVPIGEVDVEYTGRINGDDMIGRVRNPRGEVPFTGKRD